MLYDSAIEKRRLRVTADLERMELWMVVLLEDVKEWLGSLQDCRPRAVFIDQEAS